MIDHLIMECDFAIMVRWIQGWSESMHSHPLYHEIQRMVDGEVHGFTWRLNMFTMKQMVLQTRLPLMWLTIMAMFCE